MGKHIGMLIEYNPSSDSNIFPDGRVLEEAEKLYKNRDLYEEDEVIYTGSELFITALRLLVAQGKIPYDQIRFKYKEDIILLTREGFFSAGTPSGFCNTFLDLTGKLLRIYIGKYGE